MDDEERSPIDFGSRGHRSRSILQPSARECQVLHCLVFLFPFFLVEVTSYIDRKSVISSGSSYKRSVTIRREICPIRAEISTHKHGEKLYISYLYD